MSRGVNARAPHRCAAGSADSRVSERSPRRRDRTSHHRSGRCAAGRDGPGPADRAAPRLLGAHDVPEFELRRQAVGERLPADQRRAEVRNRRRGNCRGHRHRGERLTASARRAGRRLRRQGRQRHVGLRFARHADRIDHRRPPRAHRRVHRRRARCADPVAASDVGGVSAGRLPHRSERPEHHPDRGLTAQPGPCGGACGQHRRAGDQHQRGRLLQGDQADQRDRALARRSTTPSTSRARSSSSRRATPARTAPRIRRPIRRFPPIPAAGSRCRRSSARRGTRRWC